MSYLVLVRHGESQWNATGQWTGLVDIPLSDKGRTEATDAGKLISDISFNNAFTSNLSRAQETLSIILNTTLQKDVPVVKNKALNERDYGIYTEKNKWDIRKEIGDAAFQKIRRGWIEPIPRGETLKNVYERVVSYYTENILPYINVGHNVLIVAHGNSLRALVKYLENIPDDKISELEIETGEVYVYKINRRGEIESKEIRK